VRWTVIIFGILLAFQQAGIEITAFLAGLGIAGFTIGFALQDVSKNFVAGILLLLQQPFDLGDAIEVGDYAGTVTEINLRDTVVRTFDGRPVSIPNGDVFTSAIVNFSRTSSRRIDLDVGVAYGTDLKQAKEIVLQTLAELPGVVDDPAPVVVYHTFGGASIDMTIYYWLDLNEIGYFEGQSEGLMAINTAFEQAGIEIPYPIQTLLIQNQSKADTT
jgi:small-conductance mechanosensitive channel